jgi:metallo-beta-lactamase class B
MAKGQAVTDKFLDGARFASAAPWKIAVKPFRVAPKVYFVGNSYVSAYLIDTEEGLILLDTVMFGSVYMTLEAIRTLGFDPHDLKHIMLSHCHPDHDGGAEAIRQYTGAEIWLSEIDAEFKTFTDKTDAESIYVRPSYAPTRFYDDSKPMRFGSVTVQTRLTPAHTPGTTSFFITSPDDAGRPLTAAMHGGPGPISVNEAYMAKHCLTMDDLRKQFMEEGYEKLRELHVDIELPSHPPLSGILDQVPADRMDYRPMVDPGAWARFLDARIPKISKFDPNWRKQ